MTKHLTKPTNQSAKAANRVCPTVKISEVDGEAEIDVDGDYSRIATKKTGQSLVAGLIIQIANLGSQGRRTDEGAANFALGFLDAMEPKDAAEALLLTQMAATHQAMVMMARRLNHVDNIPQQDSAERALNKLARSYAAQMDTLKRYRSKGQQTVRVERVTVENGGQAIVGSVTKGGADEKK